jgi:hypothetical protein
LATQLVIDIAQEQSGVFSILNIRGEGSSHAPPQLEVQPEIANDLLRKQANEIGIA